MSTAACPFRRGPARVATRAATQQPSRGHLRQAGKGRSGLAGRRMHPIVGSRVDAVCSWAAAVDGFPAGPSPRRDRGGRGGRRRARYDAEAPKGPQTSSSRGGGWDRRVAADGCLARARARQHRAGVSSRPDRGLSPGWVLTGDAGGVHVTERNLLWATCSGIGLPGVLPTCCLARRRDSRSRAEAARDDGHAPAPHLLILTG